MRKILITSAGSTNAINVIKALRSQKEIKLSLITADTNPLAAGFSFSDKYYQTPRSDKPNFISVILKICKKEKIKIVIPTFSSELPIFARNKELLIREGVKMAISSYDSFLITEDKIKTNEYFEKWGIPSPKIYKDEEIKNKKVRFPVIIKPINKSGSKGAIKVKNWEELSFFEKFNKK